jgi:hypothetical protein
MLMRRSVFAPRFVLLLTLVGTGTWSACSGENRDFFGNPGRAGNSSTAGFSGTGANAGNAGNVSTGGSNAGGGGQGGSLAGSGGVEPTAGDTSLGGAGGSGDAGEGGAGGSPLGGEGGDANAAAGMSGGTHEAGAPNQGGHGGDSSGGSGGIAGTSGSGGIAGTSGSGGIAGTSGSSGSGPAGGSSGHGGTDPNGGTGGVPPASCQADSDCQSASEYCKKSACAAETGVCTPRAASCTGASAALAPVCGCDAMTYFSACVAEREGVNVTSQGECEAASAVRCTRSAGGSACMPSRKLARCYRPRADCNQASPTTGTCWVLPDECPAEEPEDAYYCRGTSGSAGCIGLCRVLEREDSMVRNSAQCN